MSSRPSKTSFVVETRLTQARVPLQDFHLPLAVCALLLLLFCDYLPVIHVQLRLKNLPVDSPLHRRILLLLPSFPFQFKMFTKVLAHCLLCRVTLQALPSHSLAFRLSHHPLCRLNMQTSHVLHQLQQLFLASSRSLAEAVVAEAQQGPPYPRP